MLQQQELKIPSRLDYKTYKPFLKAGARPAIGGIDKIPTASTEATNSRVRLMPFKSKAQERWAFAHKKYFAKAWAKITNQKTLPKKVKKSNKKSK